MLDAGEEYHDLPALVRGKARKNGERVAVRFPTRDVTYRELDRESDRFASGLVSAGIGPGDRVALWLGNVPEFLFAWFGIAKTGAVTVPLNTALKGELLRYELADAGPKGILLDGRLHETYAAVADGLPIVHEWGWGLPGDEGSIRTLSGTSAGLRGTAAAAPAPEIRPSDLATILYTSGTTGPPKGTMLPHERLINTPREIGRRSELSPGAVLFTTLPLFHCNAQEKTTLTAMIYDLSAAIEPKFSASTFWSTAAERGATHVSLLTSMITILDKQPESPADRAHTVRVANTAGMTAGLWSRFEQRFGVHVIESWGMTECGCTSIMNPPGEVRVGSVGRPLPFVEAQVVDDDDQPVPAGERGELVVRPRAPFTIFLGYYRKPEQTVEAWRNLWFHTGDYVTRDSDGYYYFVDRKKDVIRRRGENLAPYDVETVLNRHAGVYESVVVGVPAEVGEEDVKAFVQLKEGWEEKVGARELIEYCGKELPFYMVPRYVEFVKEIPKTANQKAQRYLLKGRRGGPNEYDRERDVPSPRGSLGATHSK